MAAARQCDICGDTYPMYNTKKDENNTNAMMFLNVDDDGKYWSHKFKDCCPHCMESIRAHIKLLGSRGE